MNRITVSIIAVLALNLASVQLMAATEILPCAVGNRWEYESIKLLRATMSIDKQPVASMRDTSSGTAVYEITAKDEKSALPVYTYIEYGEMKSTKGGEPEKTKTELIISSDKDAMQIISTLSDNYSDEAPEKQVYDPPLLYYKKDAANGKAWNVGTMRDANTKTFTSAKVTGRETVTVPAGTFKDCLRVVYTSNDLSGTMDIWGKEFNITSGQSRGVYWVAEGIGVVKELEVSTSVAETPGPAGKTVVMEAAICTESELKPGYTVK